MTVHAIDRRRPRKATHAQRKATHRNADEHDALVADNIARQECGDISRMCVWRWDRDSDMISLGWPPRIELNGRGYRSRKALEAFKANLMKRALAARGEGAAIDSEATRP
jgi:hypothetical protein